LLTEFLPGITYLSGAVRYPSASSNELALFLTAVCFGFTTNFHNGVFVLMFFVGDVMFISRFSFSLLFLYRSCDVLQTMLLLLMMMMVTHAACLHACLPAWKNGVTLTVAAAAVTDDPAPPLSRPELTWLAGGPVITDVAAAAAAAAAAAWPIRDR